MEGEHKITGNGCPFCNIAKEVIILGKSELVTAILDRFPVSEGHTLIIPNRHVANYFNLTRLEQEAIWEMVNQIKSIIDTRYHPDGYNIGINIGQSAGQTIFHVHIHLIPRYEGDIPNPKGGVRGVIPEKCLY